ncbi:site-specific integrase [Blautia schinkii]|nr:site-specific integrase [Blautia schinkii]
MKKREELLAKHPYKIFQGKDGHWYTYLPDEKKGRVKRKRETETAIEDVVVSYWKEQVENPTIEEVFTEWDDRRLQLEKISKATHLRNRQTYDRHYKEFGKRRIKSISPEDIEEFLEEQIPKYEMTAKAFSNLKTITRGFLKRAKKRKLISFNVEELFQELDTSDSDFKKVIKEDDEEVFTDEEMSRMFEYLENNIDILNLGILLMFVTGLRVGELAALKWVDFDGSGLNIRRSETRYALEDGTSAFEIKEHPKTEAGIRYVALPEEYLWIMRKLKALNTFTEFIFVRDGERLKTFSFRNRLYDVCKKTHCRPKSPHKIRKTYGSILLDNNVDRRLVMGQMGHTDIACTENHYHRNRRSKNAKVQIISNIPEFQKAK